MQTITASNTHDHDRSHDGYEQLEESIQHQIELSVNEGQPLFTTNADGLFKAFLENLPAEARQHYTCHACRHFIDRFGGLVTISEDGGKTPAMWGTVPHFFRKSVLAMEKIIKRSKINGVFITSASTLGTPVTGEWHHMSARLPYESVYTGRGLTASQKMAEKKEEFRMLISGLLEYSVDAIQQAIALLKTDSLYRSEKCLGVAEWLLSLHNQRLSTRNNDARQNFVWNAVATAPPGWCHVRSTMIGTLLDDIISGVMSFDAISRRFAEKMHPLQYQRPQAAPTSGNIAQAEKLVEKFGIEMSLVRRFARLDEIKTIWKPRTHRHESKNGSGGVFSHLKARGSRPEIKMNVPAVTMTWEKFLRTVLPSAISIEYQVTFRAQNFSAILTAEYPDAPPILQWDTEKLRNPFSQYVYHGGSLPSRWNLVPGFCKVTAVCFQPSMWHNENAHQGKSIIFILDGAKDTGYENAWNAGNAIFPETLKSEFHSVRATIEAYSKSATIKGYEDASACGIRLQDGGRFDATFRVNDGTTEMLYKIDRWD